MGTTSGETTTSFVWGAFVNSVISARASQTSRYITPLVFRRLSKRKLEEIRGHSSSKSQRECPSEETSPPLPKMITEERNRPTHGVQSSTLDVMGLRYNNGKPLSSGFRGVCRSAERWVAQSSLNGKRTRLGCYDSEEVAARMYDKMQLWLEVNGQRGKRAQLNFPRKDYDGDLPSLMEISQGELLTQMRNQGSTRSVKDTVSWGTVLFDPVSEGMAKPNPRVSNRPVTPISRLAGVIANVLMTWSRCR